MNVRGSTIGLLMQGIQDEVARRRAQIVHNDTPVANPIGELRIGDIAAAVSGVDPEVIPPQTIHLNLTLPEHMPVGPAFQQNPDAAYQLNDFSAYDDVQFIYAAFRAILKREPDEDGLKTYLAMLRDGALKAELLGRLRQSPEGRLQRTRVRGLSLSYSLDAISRWPVIGRVIGIAVAIWNLPSSQRDQRRKSNEFARRLDEVEFRGAAITRTICDALATLERSQNRFAEHTRHFAHRTRLEAAQTALAKTVEALQALQTISKNKVSQEQLDRQLRAISAQLDTKAPHATASALAQQINSVAQSKSDRAELEQWTRDFGMTMSAMQSVKADADDVALLRVFGEQLSEKISVLERSKAKVKDLQALREEGQAGLSAGVKQVMELIGRVASSKADQSNVDALRREAIGASEQTRAQISRALETKAERNEVTALTNHLIALLQQRPKSEELKVISDSLAHKANTSDLDLLQNAIESHTSLKLDGINGVLQELMRSKADQSAVSSLQDEMHVALGDAARDAEAARQSTAQDLSMTIKSLDRTKVDKADIQTLKMEAKAELEQASADLRRVLAPISAGEALMEEDHELDAMYACLEDRFRGTREDIRGRQSIYLPYVRRAKAGTHDAPIIDLGCGRGEWLELLSSEGLCARGVDRNRIFLAACLDLELDVSEQDALTYLREVEQSSIGAVTAFHLIEHCPHKYLVSLIDAIYFVLRPGGIVIFETPNPKNMIVGSCNFYLDPTHRHPLPPDLSRYLLEARGFLNVEVAELHPFGAEHQIVDGDSKMKDVLNKHFFSAQDYVVIGQKV
jgi:SAM-dependent methyltransferase